MLGITKTQFVANERACHAKEGSLIVLGQKNETITIITTSDILLFSFLYFFKIAQCCCGIFMIFLWGDYWFISAIYALWLYLDWETPETGGRRSQWVRNWTVWKYFKDYFPIHVSKALPTGLWQSFPRTSNLGQSQKWCAVKYQLVLLEYIPWHMVRKASVVCIKSWFVFLIICLIICIPCFSGHACLTPWFLFWLELCFVKVSRSLQKL